MSDLIDPVDQTPEGPLESHPLTAARLANLDEWKATGVDPYPASFDRTAFASDLHDRYSDLEPSQLTDDPVSVAGRIMLARSFGKLIFLTVEDASGRIQVFCDKAVLGENGFEAAARFEVGDWLGVSGLIMTTKKGELSVRAESMALLAKGLRPLPDKWHGLADLETRSRRRYLDLIVNPASRSIALTRSKVIGTLRREFEARGFIEVETPVLLPEAGGALARPFMTHHNALGIDMYMRIATELHLKRLVVGGLERVFEIGRIFRNEGVDATHNPEFTMLESYQVLADYHDVMEMVEEVIPAVARAALGTDQITYRGRELDLDGPYRRASFSELVSEAIGEEVDVAAGADHLRGVAIRHGVEPDEGWSPGKIIDHLFEAHVEDTLWDPVFVMDHPQDISPLAKPHRNKPGLTERFELFIAGAEYANAYSELNDPLEQRARFLEQAAAKAAGDQEAHPIDEDYLMAMEYGMPPTGGLGIGVDRLVMLLTDQSHIRDVILFPTLRPEDS